MPALLTADTTAVFHHVLIYIFVSNGCFRVVDSKLIKGLVQTEVGHDGGDNCIGQQLAALFHVFSVDVQNVVTCDHIALLIHTKTTVRIPIIGKTHVHSILHHIFLQSLNMGRTSIVVDVGAIRLGVDHVGFGAESIKNSLGNVPGASVGTVQRHLHAAEGIDTQRDQIPYVTVSSGNKVYCTADFFLLCKRDLLPFLPEDFQISIQIGFHKGNGLLVHLLPVSVDQLDSIVEIWIMACGDHNTAVKFIHSCHISHRRCGRDMEKICIRTGSHQSANQCILKHIAGTAGILSYYDTRRRVVTVPAFQFSVIPAEKTAYFICMICCQVFICLSTEAICTKIFSHFYNLILLFFPEKHLPFLLTALIRLLQIYSTVTLFARFLGLSTSSPFATLT